MAFCACIDSASIGVIERFGKYDRFAQPGFNCICCCLGEAIAGKLSLRVQQLDVICDTKTLDNVFVQLQVSVQYQVIKEQTYDAFYKLTDSHAQIRSYVFDNVRASVPRLNLDDVFTSKEEIAQGIKLELTKAMSSYGFAIIQALVTDINPNDKVKNAMNEINAASRLRVAAVEQAEALKIKTVTNAQADAEAKFLQGQGIARQRQAIVNGLRESVVQFAGEVHDVSARDVIELMMITQYFDTLKDVGTHAGNTSVFLPSGPGAVSDVTAQIRNGMLQARTQPDGSPSLPPMRR